MEKTKYLIFAIRYFIPQIFPPPWYLISNAISGDIVFRG